MPLFNLFIFYLAESEWINSFVLSFTLCMLCRAIAFPIWNEVKKLNESYKRIKKFKVVVFFILICLLCNVFFGGFVLMIAPIIILCARLKLSGYLRSSEILMQSMPALSFLVVPNYDISSLVNSNYNVVTLMIATFWSLCSVSTYIYENKEFALRSINTMLLGLLDEVFVVTYATESFVTYKIVKTAFGLCSRLQYSMNIEVYSEAVGSKSFLTDISSTTNILSLWHQLWISFTTIFLILHLISLTGLVTFQSENYFILTGSALLSSSKFVGGWSGSYFYLTATSCKIWQYNIFLLFALSLAWIAAWMISYTFFIIMAAVNLCFNLYVYNWCKRKNNAA